VTLAWQWTTASSFAFSIMRKDKGRLLSTALNIRNKLFCRSGSASPANEETQTQGAQHQLAEGPSSQNFSSTAAEKGWEGLKIALRVLEQSAKAFPPLGMAVSGLIVAIDVIEVSVPFFSQNAPPC
jgi:hypothetical protein